MPHDALKAIVGPQGWVSDPATLEPYLTEWRGTWRGSTPLMLMPASTSEVAAIVRHCVANRIAIVPQGGNTGLCGGAIPDASGEQVLLSLRRMRAVRSVSPENYTMIVEAGCVLADLQQLAEDNDRLFPLSLAAEGSCQIGGNLSTNAGGVNVLRYGTARDQVCGLEVVLPDGSVFEGLRELRKDTAGYDLKQLFIGAEGTLGIITAASLRLYPRIRHVGTALLAVPTAQQAVDVLSALRDALHDQLIAFELVSDAALQLVETHVPGTRSPLDARSPWYVLLECAAEPGDDRLEQALVMLLDNGLASDGTVAKNAAEREALWRMRHAISEAQKREGASLKHDVSVPPGSIGRFIDEATSAIEGRHAGARVIAFGHVGDGNVHLNVSQPVGAEPDTFLARRAAIAGQVYELVARFNGSFSAEHGVGVLKRGELETYRGGAEIALMRTLKRALDPHNLMNPGKVL